MSENMDYSFEVRKACKEYAEERGRELEFPKILDIRNMYLEQAPYEMVPVSRED
ncbi:MAG: hypothetical protein ABIB79_04410 [archaeon]